MNGYILALLLSLMPAIGSVVGGVLADYFRISESSMSYVLHGAAGIILAVVGVELLPQALGYGNFVEVSLAFGLGGLTYVGLEWMLEQIGERNKDLNKEKGQSPWLIYISLAFDFFTDGIMIAVGLIISQGLAFLLAVGSAISDLPSAFIAIAGFKRGGISRLRSLLFSISFAVIILLGAILGYRVGQIGSDRITIFLLSYTAGVILLAVIEGVMVEAHTRSPRTFLSEIILILGAALFTLLSAYLE
jgi:zinc transporter, ZIP family